MHSAVNTKLNSLNLLSKHFPEIYNPLLGGGEMQSKSDQDPKFTVIICFNALECDHNRSIQQDVYLRCWKDSFLVLCLSHPSKTLAKDILSPQLLDHVESITAT
jgi:hypothetical protein